MFVTAFDGVDILTVMREYENLNEVFVAVGHIIRISVYVVLGSQEEADASLDVPVGSDVQFVGEWFVI